MAEKKMILLTGVGRSGTTILQSMLNSHSEIHFPPETHFFKRYIVPFLTKKRLPVEAKLLKDSYLKRLPQAIRDSITGLEFEELGDLKSAFLKVIGNEHAPFVGDKDTEYVRYLDHLHYLFPEAYLIHIIRDPRDVVLSRTKTAWGSKRSFAFHVAEYQYYIKRVTSQGPALFGNRYLELRYEDLLNSPEEELTKLLDQMELQFQPAMLDFHKSSDKLVAKEEAGWKQNLGKPLMSDNFGKWKKSLKLKKAALVQSGIEDFMKGSKYELVNESPSSIGLIQKQLVKMLFAGKTFKERLR